MWASVSYLYSGDVYVTPPLKGWGKFFVLRTHRSLSSLSIHPLTILDRIEVSSSSPRNPYAKGLLQPPATH
ncbi:MAG: hypothetical protein D6785_03340 [Planctomycetota bacterium]|nr:MAG: hypothetical protein D6785_03340 [Planctomycetota bacterium]